MPPKTCGTDTKICINKNVKHTQLHSNSHTVFELKASVTNLCLLRNISDTSGCHHRFFRNLLQYTCLHLLSTRTFYLRTQCHGLGGSCCCSTSTEGCLEGAHLWCSCHCEPAAPGPWGWRPHPRSEPLWLRFPRRPAHYCFLPECRHPQTTPASEHGGLTYYLQWNKCWCIKVKLSI